MTLPQAEIDRIDKEADSIFNPKDLPICTPEIAYQFGELCSAYIAGATSEAIRGREQMARFAEWLGRNYRESTMYKSIEGGKLYNLRKGTLEETWKDHRIEDLIDTYILDTQKKKG